MSSCAALSLGGVILRFCCEVLITHMSNEKILGLRYIYIYISGDYTTKLYGDYNKP